MNEENVKEFINKVKEFSQKDKLDLSSNEDLSIGIMNLISTEEHLFFTSQKTGKSDYLDVLNEVREMRKQLLKKIIKEYEGEIWCISKHLLAACMRFIEVGTKQLGSGETESAKEMFEKAYSLWNLYWGVNLKIIQTSTIEHSIDQPIIKNSGFMYKLKTAIQKAVDCCIE